MKFVNVEQSLIAILLILALSSCGDKPPEFTPNFIDPVLSEVDEHSVLDKDNLIISPEPVKTYHLSESKESWFCVPKSQAAPWVNFILKKKRELEACKK